MKRAALLLAALFAISMLPMPVASAKEYAPSSDGNPPRVPLVRQQIYRMDAGRVFTNKCGSALHVQWPHWSDPIRLYGFTFVVTAYGGGRLIATVQNVTVTADVPYDNTPRQYTMVVRYEQVPPELVTIRLASHRDPCGDGAALTITGLDVFAEDVPIP